MTYMRNCNVCHQRIVMAKNQYGYWQPLEPDESGRHEHFRERTPFILGTRIKQARVKVGVSQICASLLLTRLNVGGVGRGLFSH